MNDDVSTNAPPVQAVPPFISHLPKWMHHVWLELLAVALIAPGIYYLMLLLGRRLKRKHGVRLGILYHLFSLGFAIFLPAVLLLKDSPIIHHIGAATVISGGVFLISLVDRYVWE